MARELSHRGEQEQRGEGRRAGGGRRESKDLTFWRNRSASSSMMLTAISSGYPDNRSQNNSKNSFSLAAWISEKILGS
jgi:hypothetical protein